MQRKITRSIRVRDVIIGGGAPISIQSMTNVDPKDREGTLSQIRALQEAGCDVVRLAIPDLASAEVFHYLRESGVSVPLVADVHFDYRIAIRAMQMGADKVRINPGNVGSRDHVEAVVREAKARSIPLRIGVNSGSLEPVLLKKYGSPTPEALVESALGHLSILEELDFHDVAISIKASSVTDTVVANRMLSLRTDAPIHLGVTETGGSLSSIVKSSVGIGTLLAEGIGDTVRVSLTDDPVHEVELGREILCALDLYSRPRMQIIACPTCGRTRVDLISLVRTFETRAKEERLMDKGLKVALMGCAVNGPGEAREADIGIACGDGEGLLFVRGKTVCKLPESSLIDALIDKIKEL